ncbi:hypothetical protein M422DRAFT_54471 [Sphaerobolus stellatus SS14]|uniref:Uncharacterized protein n=1 Tax=Sphaerobolus stellatus (strain SS14) TaxID=990650 RepID=A0A0C9UTY7_SPHS4|nr:hypothetical protein M422DRAFT_54471 [Sphaerobolus stellatus SS14]
MDNSIGFQAIQLAYDAYIGENERYDVEPPNPLPTSHLSDMRWSFNLLDNYLISRIEQYSNGNYRMQAYAQSVFSYFSTAGRDSARQILLSVAVWYGFRPEFNFRELSDERVFELNLFDEVLARRSMFTDDRASSFFHTIVPWHNILSGSASLIDELIPYGFTANRSYIPTASWLSMLGVDGRRLHHGCGLVHLTILKDLVILDDKNPACDRLWSFYIAFNTDVELHGPEAVPSIIQLLEPPENQTPKQWSSWCLNNIPPLLLALGIVKWPEDLPPHDIYIKILCWALEATSPIYIREVALRAAWCYRKQLQRLTDKSLWERLLSAALAAATPFDDNWLKYRSKDTRLLQYFDLIHVLTNSTWGCPFAYHELPTSFVDTIENVIREDLQDPGWMITHILAMLHHLNEVSPERSSTQAPLIVSVWRYLSGYAKITLGEGIDKDSSRQKTPFDIMKPSGRFVWIWEHIIAWSYHNIEESFKLDLDCLGELYGNFRLFNDLFEQRLEVELNFNEQTSFYSSNLGSKVRGEIQLDEVLQEEELRAYGRPPAGPSSNT